MTHIGYSKLSEIQRASNAHDLANKPVAPDLWFIDKQGDFHFIEVKLPGDRIALHQVIGMSILKEYFDKSSILIINLKPQSILLHN
jgi:hypothetical protein